MNSPFDEHQAPCPLIVQRMGGNCNWTTAAVAAAGPTSVDTADAAISAMSVFAPIRSS
jgi:hypothetical protein